MVSKLILGTAQLGIPYGINNDLGQPSTDTAYEILQVAQNNNIKYLDTAAAYGSSEKIIGDFHRKNNHFFSVITKFHVNSEEFIENQVSQASIKLNKKYIEVFQLHSYQDLIDSPHVLDILSRLKDKGIIKRIGISLYTNEEIESILQISEIDVIQVPFNLLDNDFHRGAHLSQAKSKGKEVHVRSVFLQGLFFKPITDLPPMFLPIKKQLREMKELANQNGLSVAKLALSYPLAKNYIDGVLIGVETVSQLKENIRFMNTSLSEELINQIDLIKVKSIDLLNPSNWKR